MSDGETMGMDEADDLNLLALVAKAADVCRPPWRHAVRDNGAGSEQMPGRRDCVLFIEARDGGGERCPEQDLELEIYRSGDDLNLMLCRRNDDQSPLLWHGSHPVWMDGSSGVRCDRPSDGVPLEALCRRLRALLNENL